MSEGSTFSEQDLANRLGVDTEEVQDFLHDHTPYEERIGIHDVLECNRCQEETSHVEN